MTTLRHLVILNPVAAKGAALQRLPELESLLAGKAIVYDLVLTERVWHAAELARDAGRKGYDAVISGGGDGTMNEVINGLMMADAKREKLPIMGALALGRGNDFAYGADIPATLEDGVAAIAPGDDVAAAQRVDQLVDGDAAEVFNDQFSFCGIKMG